jgi:hypothetical protein
VFGSTTPPLSWGLEAPTNLGDRIARLSNPLPPDAVLDGTAGAQELVRIWRATGNRKATTDHLAWAVLLDAIRRGMESRPPHLREALAAHRMHLGRTVAEVNLQLGSRLYHLAWTLVTQRADDPVVRTIFQRCVEAHDHAEAQRARLPASAVGGLTGMRGVARIVLARDEEDPVERLEAAVADLATAEMHGDTSAPHYAFLTEAHLRLLELVGDDHLASAEAVLGRADAAGHRTRALELARAESVARRAFEALAADREHAAVTLFDRASQTCTDALGIRADAVGTSDELVRARRGQWQFQRALLEKDSPARIALLDTAIADLRPKALRGTSLPRALLARAEATRQAGNWDEALSDSEEARAYVESTGVGDEQLRGRIERLAREAATWSAVDGGKPADALVSVRRLLHAAQTSSVSLAAISHGLRAAAPLLGPLELQELCAHAAQIARAELDDTTLGAEARRFAASHGASLLWTIAHVRDDISLVSLAHGLFRDGIAVGDEPVTIEMLSTAGACALRLAKLLASRSEHDREEAIDLLDDARRYLVAALDAWDRAGGPTNPDAAITWSTLGDACARRYGLTHDVADADEAIKALTLARTLGADSRRIDGLLGQVHYRRGRIMRSAPDLDAALRFKHAAAEGTAASRENLSVCAAAELTLYDLDGGDHHLVAAAEYAAAALDADPHWPWPLLQLAAIAKQIEARDVQDGEANPLELALAGREQQLLRMAAERAVATTEFGQHVLGGRQKAFVLSDPHSLLAPTLVLKPTPRKNAEREWQESLAVHDFIVSRGEAGMRVPEPLAIIDRPSGHPVYVMRRANGRELGRSSQTLETPADHVPSTRFSELCASSPCFTREPPAGSASCARGRRRPDAKQHATMDEACSCWERRQTM